MPYQEANPPRSEILNIKTIGEAVEGYFLQVRNGTFGFLYDFISKKGVSFTLKQNSDLVQKMAIIPFRVHCKIKLLRMEKTHGGNDMKIFDIQYNSDDVYKKESANTGTKSDPTQGLREPGTDDV